MLDYQPATTIPYKSEFEEAIERKEEQRELAKAEQAVESSQIEELVSNFPPTQSCGI